MVERSYCRKNFDSAIKYLKKAASKIFTLALIQLGIIYARGEYVDRNLELAKKYFVHASVDDDLREYSNKALHFISNEIFYFRDDLSFEILMESELIENNLKNLENNDRLIKFAEMNPYAQYQLGANLFGIETEKAKVSQKKL